MPGLEKLHLLRWKFSSGSVNKFMSLNKSWCSVNVGQSYFYPSRRMRAVKIKWKSHCVLLIFRLSLSLEVSLPLFMDGKSFREKCCPIFPSRPPKYIEMKLKPIRLKSLSVSPSLLSIAVVLARISWESGSSVWYRLQSESRLSSYRRGLGWRDATPCFCSRFGRWTMGALVSAETEAASLVLCGSSVFCWWGLNLVTRNVSLCSTVNVFTLCMGVSGNMFILLDEYIQIWMLLHWLTYCVLSCDADLYSCGPEYCLDALLQVYSFRVLGNMCSGFPLIIDNNICFGEFLVKALDAWRSLYCEFRLLLALGSKKKRTNLDNQEVYLTIFGIWSARIFF